MKNYINMSKKELIEEKEKVMHEYQKFKSLGLKLDMSRGKPSKEQVNLSMDMLDVINSKSDCISQDGIDCRNYGILEGLREIRKLFSDMMGVNEDDIIIGGNSSLNMMFDVISCFMTHEISGEKPWLKQEKIKFLCPSPGYDRHFAICEYFGMELIPIKMNSDGPDMNKVENLVENDITVKGIWCVPKYSNPQGIVYSDEVIKRLSSLKPKAKDFRIFWDNAYCVHDLEESVEILNIMDECVKNGNEELPILFSSTSKITFPGAGISALACRGNNMDILKKRFSMQTIGYDKINQLRHIRYLKNLDNLKLHMLKHRNILKPKFELVISKLRKEFEENEIIKWDTPKGGYFVSVYVMNGCAKEVVRLCKEAGVIITNAGATYPYGKDPFDSNIRLAPSYPDIKELDKAMDLFMICVKLAALNKLIESNV